MMAKMFYTMEEAKAALGTSEDEIKAYAREGRLREFRDGPRLMFKADQVDQLKAEMAGGGGLDTVDLGMSDSGGMTGLVDTTGASGTSITLSDADTGQSPGGAGGSMGGSPALIGGGGGGGGGGGSAGSTAGGIRMKDDTALAADLGLSGTMGGSLGGVPSPGRAASGTGLSGSMGGGRSGAGINVFGSEDVVERVDPSAQTAISGGIRDQIDLQGVGSGSGLLDLTRESDDTSLGAVLDEITPGGTTAGRRSPGFDAGEASFGAVLEDSPAPRVAAPPVYIQQADPLAPAFGGAALAAAGVCMFGAFVLITSLLGTHPNALKWFKDQNMNPFVIASMGLGVVLVFFVFGLIFGKLGKR